jgi:DNA mismatch endonuclease, patch repair protein
MSRIRCKDTAPEMAVRRLIYSMGFRYRLHVHSLPGRPDLVFTRLRKVIQIHGCFWHQHGSCPQSHLPKSRMEYWHPKLAKNRRRDKQNVKKLRAQGWAVLTLWECQLNDMEEIRQRLTAFLETGLG